MKKPMADPYDVDKFIVSLSQKHVLPIKMKETFPVITNKDRYYVIDTDRIMVLLRISIPSDSNAVYIVRQITEEGRKFEAWKYITLSQIIMSAR